MSAFFAWLRAAPPARNDAPACALEDDWLDLGVAEADACASARAQTVAEVRARGIAYMVECVKERRLDRPHEFHVLGPRDTPPARYSGTLLRISTRESSEPAPAQRILIEPTPVRAPAPQRMLAVLAPPAAKTPRRATRNLLLRVALHSNVPARVFAPPLEAPPLATHRKMPRAPVYARNDRQHLSRR
jgi:hypothetical protein